MTSSHKKSTTQLGMREPVPNPTEQRVRFVALAHSLRDGIPLSKEHTEYLASCFEKIGRGESADVVFLLKRRRGQRAKDEDQRRKMSLVFAQIAHYIASTEGHPPGEGLSLTEALQKVVPLAQAIFGVDNTESYSPEYLNRVWHDPSYAHMRTTLRTPFDPDSPLAFAPSKS